jgi:hypothetical protein
MVSLQQAIDQINKANPFMGELLNCEEKLIDYVKNRLTNYHPDPTQLERQKPYVKLIKRKINKLFPNEDIRINYAEGMILDTTDHHNVINYPTIVGAHVISRFDTITDRKNFGDYYVLDCGNVPFSDALHKRGVQIGGKHLNLYPKALKNKLVSRYPKYDFDLMEWVRKSEQKFSEKELEFIRYVQELINNIDFSTCERLSDQIVKINHQLWLEFFDPEIRDSVRHCIALEHDEILRDFLIDFFQQDQDNIVWKSLFDKDFREKVLMEFKGIYGAWDYLGENSGTHFFWGFDGDDCKEYRMELRDGVLVNPEGKVRDVPLTPESVIQGLKDGVIIPAIFTKFTTVAFYLGAKTMGGPGQTEYVGKLHRVWLKILKQSDPEEYKLVKQVTSLNFNCGDLAFVKDEKGNIVKEWAWDIAMNHRFSNSYLQKLSQVKFKYLLYPFIPISYYRLTPAAERQTVDYQEKDLYQGFNWVK